MFLTASSYQIKSKNYFLFWKTYVATGTIIAIAITNLVVKFITVLLSKAPLCKGSCQRSWLRDCFFYMFTTPPFRFRSTPPLTQGRLFYFAKFRQSYYTHVKSKQKSLCIFLIINLYKTIGNDRAAGEEFILWCAKFAEANNMEITITVSDDPNLASEEIKKYL